MKTMNGIISSIEHMEDAEKLYRLVIDNPERVRSFFRNAVLAHEIIETIRNEELDHHPNDPIQIQKRKRKNK